ncbi:hypothetical protein EON80_15985, partial [bacterium]
MSLFNTSNMRFFTVGFLVALTGVAQAQSFPSTEVKTADYTLTARAYIDPDYLPGTKLNPASRYALTITTTPNAPYQWDFSLPDSPSSNYTNIIRADGKTDYKNLKKTKINATLHQYVTYDEKVTFKDLNLAPSDSSALTQGLGQTSGPRFLSLPEERSLTTPSGVTVTLPAQLGFQIEDINRVMNGNIDALWVRIKTTPSTTLSDLPTSPLFLKHGRPVRLKLEVLFPNFLVSYAADNTFTGVKVGIRGLKSLTHIDELTFI